MPDSHDVTRTGPRLDRRRLLGGAATGLLIAALPGDRLAIASSAGHAGIRVLARQDVAGGPALAEQWLVPDDLPGIPDVSAASAFVGDIETGRVLFARDADVQLAPASTAKIAVALTVLDILTDLDEVVTIEREDEVDRSVYSNAQLQAEDEVTVRNLLYGLLLPSGNDAARAVARFGGLALDPDSDDPTATFLDAVNAKAVNLGATATTILQPAGEDRDGQVTTARDLAILAAALLDDEILAEIVATGSYDMEVAGPYERLILLTNTNALLGNDGIIGVKTGSSEAAGACLVTGVQMDGGERVVIAVMGSTRSYDADGILIEDRRYDDTLALLDAISAEYGLAPVPTESTMVVPAPETPPEAP